eukprot:CAMPEP_0185790012 /NCGR_PEP_ID=MMETSP1174-20130828/154096_1 /TAXON_ID=35687 /ORGANISM="Dictyocha speculum, Strain CCMP1381" /LENGTH=111 /DNA_ID=CAMNT_0028484463 /DNA_START=335 /DNA_END=670 /DNA_ORIENTATION=+
MGGHELVHIPRPHEVAHLGAGVNAVQRHGRESVPKTDAAICCPATRSKKAMLVWRPCDGFHCGGVLVKAAERIGRLRCPNQKFVVVTPGRKLSLVKGPAESANLLLVACKF